MSFAKKAVLLLCGVLLLAGCVSVPAGGQEGKMILFVTLSDGFDHQRTVLRVDGKVVLSKKLLADESSGVAAYIEPGVIGSPAQLEIEVPGLKLKSEFTLDLENGRYLDIGVRDGQVQWSQAVKPYLYD